MGLTARPDSPDMVLRPLTSVRTLIVTLLMVLMAKIGCHGRLIDLSDVGCHLGDDGNGNITFYVCGVEQYQFRILSHVAAHASQSHLRTGEIQFHSIAACFFSHLSEFYPFFLKFSHDAGHYNFCRVVLLQTVKNVEVNLVGVLAQLFHVTKGIEVRYPFLLASIEAR